MSRLGVALVLLLASCKEHGPAPADLAAYLRGVARADDATRARELETWRFDRATWDATVIAPYRPLFELYELQFELDKARFADRLGPGAIAARPHFAGDPELTRGEAIARWALPPLFASEVASLDGRDLDAVFVRTSRGWRVIAGLDRIVWTHIARHDPACAEIIHRIEPAGRCIEAAWAVADAALGEDTERVARACALATSLCGIRSP